MEKKNVAKPTRQHRHVAISKKLLQDYKDKGGAKILLVMVEDDKKDVVLEFVGFKANGEECFDEQKLLEVIPKSPPVPLKNLILGFLKEDEKGNSLHKVLTSGTLRDWELIPQKCGTGKDMYVGFLMSDKGVTKVILNPSPPAGAD